MKDKETAKFIKIAVIAFVTVVFSAIAIFGVVMRADYDKMTGVLTPFAYAFAIAYILNYIVNFFNSNIMKIIGKVFAKELGKKMTRFVKYSSILLAYLVAGVAIYLFAITMVPQITASVTDLVKNYEKYLYTGFEWFDKYISQNDVFKDFIRSENFHNALMGIVDYLVGLIGNISPKFIGFFTNFANEVKNIMLGLFISVYMLVGKETFRAQSKKLLFAFTDEHTSNKVLTFTRECDLRFGGFIVGKIIDSLIIGIICYVCCVIFKFPFAALISLIIGITNIVPIAGPFIGAIPSAFLIFITAPEKTLWFILFVLVLQQLDGNFIGPLILGDKTGLSAFWVLAALVVMGGLYGIVGMVLAVPVFSVIYYEIKLQAERRLTAKNLPVATNEYAGDGEKFLVDSASQREKRRKKDKKD